MAADVGDLLQEIRYVHETCVISMICLIVCVCRLVFMCVSLILSSKCGLTSTSQCSRIHVLLEFVA